MLSCRSVLLLCFIGFSLGGYTQEKIIQLDAEQTMLHDIFNELEQQTGYAFTYDAKLIRLQRRVSIRTAGNLGDVLDVLGKKTMLDMQISGRNILVRPVRYGKLSGKVVDEQGVPLAAVNVYVREFNQQYITDEQGGFSINYPVSRYAKLNLAFSMLGRQEQTMELSLAEQHQTVPTMTMPTLSVGLEEIAVNPTTRKELSSNSSLYINREVIEQSGALSLHDLLNLVPNKKIESPSLQRVQQATLRSNTLSTGSQGARDPFAMNNAFGVAIIMDGIALSNNSNMQTLNPGMTGMGNASVDVGTSGLVGSTDRGMRYSGDYAYGGIDLRQIATDNIESIEVVAGVASAKYGDLTDGAIIVNRIAGRSPLHFSMQLRDNATVYGLSKGFQTNKWGAFTIGGNFTRSFQDNRDKLKSYDRLSTNMMWSTSAGFNKAFTNTLSADYGRNLDNVRRDPDDPTASLARFRNYNFSVANRSNYRIDQGFLTNVGLNLRYSQSYQNTYRERFMNGTYIIYSDATEVGLTKGIYAPGIYTSVDHIEGKPVDVSARLDLNGKYYTGDVLHQLSFGLNYNYAKNLGRGQLVDPSRPNQLVSAATSGNRSARYYDFSTIHAQQQLGIYVENTFETRLANRPLYTRVGTRVDKFEQYLTFSPRANLSYELTPDFQLGLAYGYASKAPALGQLYPGPVYFEIPLFQHTAVTESGAVDEVNSLYLLYVDKFMPDNSALKPSGSQQWEGTVRYHKRGFQLGLNLYLKETFRGISTLNDYALIELDEYHRNPSGAPLYIIDGRKQYRLPRHRFANLNKTRNSGIELMASTPKWEAIQTSFNLRGGISQTVYNPSTNSQRNFTNPSTDVDYAVTGVYPGLKRKSVSSNAAITSSTHIPKANLVINFIAEVNLINRTDTDAAEGVPIAYYTADGRYITIENFDQNNLQYRHLLVPQQELNNQNQPAVYSNFHLNLSKEITKRLTLTFQVYNVFNYRPQYLRSDNTLIIPNDKPTYGAQLRLKI
ncbi:TonB-dependent receptor [Sphingobacterium arenae]|uniref:TonB-dependent receptor n=1 Tax=Sphingobacterium arenae TaxID=1280598 RepID=A0ABR7Y2S8_9SPHI|nr:TonB-dependent receptor [Sphingobacterium arenae]MBD1425615.1 TonB-dependent receptor [Sphingobacterium arenae]